MAPTIESDENDLIKKVVTDAEQNLNCDFSLKTEQKSAFHAICKGTNMFTTKPPIIAQSIRWNFIESI